MLIFNGCIRTTDTGKELLYTIDTLCIKTHENGLSLTDAPYFLKTDTADYYIAYNEAFNVLLFFDLQAREYKKKVQFTKSGPGKLYSCEEYVIKGDTIIVNDILAIKLFNFNGELIESLEMKKLCPELDREYKLAKSGINIGNLFKMHLNKPDGSIVLRTFRKGLPYEDGFYKNPSFCEYNFNSMKGKKINVIYPEEIYSNIFYDDLAAPNIISYDQFILYNFHFKASIFKYNKTTHETNEIEFNVEHIPQLVKGVKRSTVSGITDLFFGPKYHNLKFDPYKRMFYMVYSDGDKSVEKNYLLVFNEKLEKLGELDLPIGLSAEFVVSPDGLLFRNMDDLDYYNFYLYRINFNFS